MITFFKKTINYHYDNENVENLDQLIDKIHNNDIDAAKNIIQKHATNILNLQDGHGKTALMWAIIYKNKELVELILSKNPNVNIRDNSRKTALMWAIKTENKELVKLILSKNPNVNIRDNDEKTAFDYAEDSSNEEIKKLFNEDSKIYKANQAFENLIDKIHNNDIGGVKNIIENQANILNLQDRDEETALMFAIRKENKELVELILSKGADVNIMNNDGETAFNYASSYDINLQELIDKVKSSKGN